MNSVVKPPSVVSSANFADPTATIAALISKFSLSLLILASGFIFYEMSNRNTSKIPKNLSILAAIMLVTLSCSISIFATYEFYNIVPKYNSYCKTSINCLYTPSSLGIVTTFYLIFAVIYNLTNVYIALLLFKYHK